MFGSYLESVKIIEKLMELYHRMDLLDNESQIAINALRAARALILEEEEKATIKCEEHFRAEGLSFSKDDFMDLPFDVRVFDKK